MIIDYFYTPPAEFFLFCTYLVAAIPFGVLISHFVAGRDDSRRWVSGNTGAANVSRLMGRKWGGRGPCFGCP